MEFTSMNDPAINTWLGINEFSSLDDPAIDSWLNSSYDNIGYSTGDDNISTSALRNLSNLGGNLWSTLIPAIGAGVLGELNGNKPGQYYIQRNWKGNGLANIGLGYTSNNRYQNPYGFGYALSGIANEYNPFKAGFKRKNNEV